MGGGVSICHVLAGWLTSANSCTRMGVGNKGDPGGCEDMGCQVHSFNKGFPLKQFTRSPCPLPLDLPCFQPPCTRMRWRITTFHPTLGMFTTLTSTSITTCWTTFRHLASLFFCYVFFIATVCGLGSLLFLLLSLLMCLGALFPSKEESRSGCWWPSQWACADAQEQASQSSRLSAFASTPVKNKFLELLGAKYMFFSFFLACYYWYYSSISGPKVEPKFCIFSITRGIILGTFFLQFLGQLLEPFRGPVCLVFERPLFLRGFMW